MSWLPTVNATLNALAALLLCLGWWSIRAGHVDRHRRLMLASFGVSAGFLVCYAVYHAALHHYTGSGSRRFAGVGWIRTVYLSVLVSHSVLAALVPFLAVTTIYRAWVGDWQRHRRLARWTFPIWLYVSVTGVIVYLLLYHWPNR